MDATTDSQQTPSSSQPPTPPNSIHDITLPPPITTTTTTKTTPSPENESLPNNEQHETTTTTGIDVNEAISILSSRARAKAKSKQRRRELNSTTTPTTTADDNDNDNDNDDEQPTTITAEQRKMGQTIDLLRSQEWARIGDDDDGCGMTEESTTTTTTNNEEESTTASQQSPPTTTNNTNTNTERQKLLQSQTPSQLLQTLFQLQQERVLTYRQFDDGLDVVLQTGNLTQYPHLTVRVTAAFAVVSGSINEVANVFRYRQPRRSGDTDDTNNEDDNDAGSGGGGKEVVTWIETLQKFEKEKLNYTAALHLEKIRGRNEVVEREIAFQNASAGGGEGGGNERIAKLLEESIVSLQGKVTGCVEGINEILEELRYAAADMDE